MELTAESLQQVKFGAKVRGYDPEEVDRFIVNVSEIGEELHERLRRATERATTAEQQLAQVSANPPPPAEAAVPQQSAELGRVWERAVAAAEGAVEEARQEAQTILEDARRAADEAVTGAQHEAKRMAEESQSQLRADIARLESARDQLKGDVDGMASFLGGEKSRLRASIAKALADIDDYGSVGQSSPVLSQVEVPPQKESTFAAPLPSAAAPAPPYSAPQPKPEPEPQPPPQPQANYEDPPLPVFAQEARQADPNPNPEREPDREPETPSGAFHEPDQPAWVVDQPIEEPAPAQAQWQEPPQNKPQEEDEGDPFLAELRRAVRDDGPLGPRDEEENQEDSIDRLYASDEDDKSFFKRKK